MTKPKRIGRPPREVQRFTVSVRFEPQELAEIDKARGEVSRQDWIHGLALGHTRVVNRRPAPVGPSATVAKIEREFGPQRAAAGSRLKK